MSVQNHSTLDSQFRNALLSVGCTHMCPCVNAVLIMFIMKNIAGGRIFASSIKPCHVCPEMQAEEIGLLR